MNPKPSTPSKAPAAIGAAFLTTGATSLAFAIIQETSTLAFIGLGLTFWGALFIIITPRRYVESSLLETAALPNYQTADRVIKNLQKPAAYHIPPYPKDAALPEHLKGLKDMIVFITNENEKPTPDIQELTEGKLILHKPPGTAIAPPGIGLLNAVENKTKTDFTKTTLQELCETLPNLILQNFPIANDMELTITNQDTVKLKLTNSTYKNLYSNPNNPKSIRILGCPITSATACAIAKTTGKPTTIQNTETSPRGHRLQATIKIKQD